MNIVFLDRKSIGDDLDISRFEAFGNIQTYDFTTPDEAPERVADADILIVNKTLINAETMRTAKRLKLVCVTATGTNNLDKDYLSSRNIAWRNVAGYSTESVAQHTFALLFYLWEHLPYYDSYVKGGGYANDRLFTHFSKKFHELSGMTWGIIGLGAIGRRVAEIAGNFGCHVQYYSTSGKNHTDEFTEVSFDTLLRTSDIISIHAPLNQDTGHLIDENALSKMKQSAILLNLGRGQIIDERALRNALDDHVIYGAGLDVLSEEPMRKDSALSGFSDSDRLFITPHIGWASVEARTRLMDSIYHQIEEFIGSPDL